MTAKERKEAQEEFLKAFALNANVMLSCKKARIDRSQIYRWQEHDDAFALRFKQAEADANDMIRGALFQRAVQGIERPALSMGRLVYEEIPMLDREGNPVLDERNRPVMTRKLVMLREYSDSLLALLAKARMPEFREKTGGTIIITPKEYVNLPEDGTEL